jgi:hypothetical protein
MYVYVQNILHMYVHFFKSLPDFPIYYSEASIKGLTEEFDLYSIPCAQTLFSVLHNHDSDY